MLILIEEQLAESGIALDSWPLLILLWLVWLSAGELSDEFVSVRDESEVDSAVGLRSAGKRRGAYS